MFKTDRLPTLDHEDAGLMMKQLHHRLNSECENYKTKNGTELTQDLLQEKAIIDLEMQAIYGDMDVEEGPETAKRLEELQARIQLLIDKLNHESRPN